METDQLKFENGRLAETLAFARERLAFLRGSIDTAKEALISAKQELWENTAHSVGNLWSSEEFEALAEMSQYAVAVTDKLAQIEKTQNEIARLERLVKSPYFAAIDFRYDGEDTFERFYIGRSSLMKSAYEFAVYDWRSPIASVFYRFTNGRAFYDAPVGKIEGELGLKRQFEIKDSVLEFLFDSDLEIADEFLRKTLARNASPQMKSVVETIQRDQDAVIRDMESDLLMVQGIAGSGKTSVALHRAAYLMYQNISAASICIISPNDVFERYIENVLPELGEDDAVSLVFEDIIADVLGAQRRKNIQTRGEFLEALLCGQEIMRDSLAFKTSETFRKILNRSDGNYSRLFTDGDYFFQTAKALALPENISEIISFTRENLRGKALFYDDAVAQTHLKLKRGLSADALKCYKYITNVVVDEAQDYYPLHFEIFKLLFPSAKFTVLGDVGQTIEKSADSSFYENVAKILDKRRSSLVTLNKSFRCTREILNFSAKFLFINTESAAAAESFNRSGDEPKIFSFAAEADYLAAILREIAASKAAGYASVALICKTEKEAAALRVKLSGEDVTVTPVYAAKGLEYDAVLVCGINPADGKNNKLLYTACTRALHRLNIFYPEFC